MDLQAVRESLEKGGEDILPTATLDALPSEFYDNFVLKGIRIDHVEPGRVVCSMRVPPRLLVGSPPPPRPPNNTDPLLSPFHVCFFLIIVATTGQNSGKFLHGGATASLVDIVGSAAFLSVGCPTSGVSLEINISYLDAAFADEEIEIECKVLRAGKAVGVVAVELRKKDCGKIIAQGRHTKYLAASSKL